MCVHTKHGLVFLINQYLCNVTVQNMHKGNGPHCKAVFSLQSSPVCNLKFANLGGKLAVGYECGRVRSSTIFFLLNEMVHLLLVKVLT